MTKSEINHINSADVVLSDTTEVMRQYLKIKQENPEKFKKMTQKRNQLIQELFEKNKEEMYWFDTIEEK